MIDSKVSQQISDSEEAEKRYLEVSQAISKELRFIHETRSLFIQFEIRMYDQIHKFREELEKIKEVLK